MSDQPIMDLFGIRFGFSSDQFFVRDSVGSSQLQIDRRQGSKLRFRDAQKQRIEYLSVGIIQIEVNRT